MGCCASTAKTPHDGGSKSPPPVDEVLSSSPVLRFQSGSAPAFRRPRFSSPTFLKEVMREKAPAAGESSRSVTRSDPGSPGSKSSKRNGSYSGWVGFGSGKMTRNGEGKAREELARPPTNNALLENSLVSLECFIFL